MKKIVLFAVFTLILNKFEVIGQITFQKSFTTIHGDCPIVKEISGQGYVIIGSRIIKTNAVGDTLMTKSYDFGQSKTTCGDITYDGGYAISGHTSSFGAGDEDVFLVRTDSLGNILWSKTYGGMYEDEASYMVKTSDSGFIIAGHSNIVSPGFNYDVLLIKVDKNGSVVWSKTIGIANNDEDATSIQQTNDNGFIITGRSNSIISASSESVFVIKTDSSGNILWSKSYDSQIDEVIFSIRQTSDGGYILAGDQFFPGSSTIIFIFKIDSSGAVLWTNSFDSENMAASSIEQTQDGGFIISCETFISMPITMPTGYYFCLIRTNSDGDTLWTRAYGMAGATTGSSAIQTSDGGFIAAVQNSSFGNGYYVIKTDSLGNSGCHEVHSYMTSFSSPIPASNVVFTSTSGVIESSFPVVVYNGTSVTSLCSANTGIENLTLNSQLNIFPNPAYESFLISFENKINNGVVDVFNVQGASVYKKEISNTSTIEIDLKGYNPGIYLIQLFDGKEFYMNKIIVSEK